jgi:uncharacterized membrane protein YfcA
MTALLVGLLVGACMGFFGAGAGSITIPLAVHFMHLPYRTAGIAGLVVVLSSGIATALIFSRKSLVDFRAALPFLLLSTPTTLIAAKLSRHISNRVSTLLLVALLLSAATALWFRHQERKAEHDIVRGSIGAIAAGGASGVLGVGAGFVVVPALRLASGLTIAKAVATSALILAVNSIAALAVRYNEMKSITSLWLLAVAAVGGATLASSLSHRIPPKLRQRGLALLLMGFAIVTLLDALKS